VAIEAAAAYPDRVKRVALIAGAMAIPVNQQLLDMSDKALAKAINVMTSWGHGPMAHMHDNTQPGHSFIGYGQRLMSLNDNDALRADLNACNGYKNGPAAAKSLTQPALCILAENDRMTPVKFGREMATTLNHAEMTIIAGAGHMLPAEYPAEVNAALRSFFQPS
jgi:pimeloyl-ACP methyl ester carboxylesterase